MAIKEKNGTTETQEKSCEIKAVEGKAEVKPCTSVYTAKELVANAKEVFHVRAECVEAALKAAGITECTIVKAKEVVTAFMKREVK